MRGIILAAGRGSRMGALTDERPKCMVEFCGKSLLTWQREALTAAGVTKLGIVAGYRRTSLATEGLEVFENPGWATSNMVRSLLAADAWLRDDACIISYSDIFYGPDAIHLLQQTNAALGVLYDVNWRVQWKSRFADPLTDAESLRIDANGAIREIGRRARSLDEIEGQYMGLLRVTPAGWRTIRDYLSTLPKSETDQVSMTRLLDALIAKGDQVSGIPFTGWWGEIDSPDDIVAHNDRLKRGEDRQASFSFPPPKCRPPIG